MTTADAAIIGGSGLYSLFERGTSGHVASIPAGDLAGDYGPPSGDVQVARLGSRTVAFLPRHGAGHRWPPHRVPYRANIRALADLGVRQIIAPCAAGSLRRDTPPGTLVVPDQLVDHTHGRVQTFFDDFAHGIHHAQFAEPYCPQVRQTLLASSSAARWQAVDGGTMVVIDGPRFSTRAELHAYTAAGWDLMNMTGHPEAVLAREVGICYASLALVTNYSVTITGGAGANAAEVLAEFDRNAARLRDLLAVAAAGLPAPGSCTCAGE